LALRLEWQWFRNRQTCPSVRNLLDELPENLVIAPTMVQQGSVPLHTTPRPAWRFSSGIGQRIGQYETQKRLGEGGMGWLTSGTRRRFVTHSSWRESTN